MNSILTTVLAAICLFSSCTLHNDSTVEHKRVAQAYFKSVYSGDTTLLDSLADRNITSSYAVFEKIFGKNTIDGLGALKEFSAGFSDRWREPKVEFNEILAEGNKVVLVWSFEAKRYQVESDSSSAGTNFRKWGGITLLHFNQNGKVTLETGEESTPGPYGRLKTE